MQSLSISPAKTAAVFIQTDPHDLPSVRLRMIADCVELFDSAVRPTPDAVISATVDGLLSIVVELLGDTNLPASVELFDAAELFLTANGRF